MGGILEASGYRGEIAVSDSGGFSGDGFEEAGVLFIEAEGGGETWEGEFGDVFGSQRGFPVCGGVGGSEALLFELGVEGVFELVE